MYDKLGRLMLPLSIVTALNALAMGWVFWNLADQTRVMIWLGPLLLFSAFQYFSGIKITRRDRSRIPSGKFLKRAQRNTFFFALWWASSCYLLAGQSDTLNLTLVSASIGMCVAACACIGPLAGVASRFVQGALPLTISAMFFTHNEAVTAVLLMGTALSCVLVYMAHLKYMDTVAMLRAQMDATSAITRLENSLRTAPSGIRITDSQGNLVIQNDKYDSLIDDSTLESTKSAADIFHHRGRFIRHRESKTNTGDIVSVAEDLTDLIKYQHQIEAARKQAETSDDAKSRFLSAMSTELVQPANMIQSLSTIMMPHSKVPLDQQDIGTYATDINNAARQLLALIENVLDYSRLENSEIIDENVELIDMNSFLADAIGVAMRTNDRPNRLSDLSVHIAPVISQIFVDHTSLLRIVSNVCTNAMIFSHPGTPIIVRCGIDQTGTPVIIVRDKGLGISAKNIDKVMRPFTKVENDTSNPWHGPGLGLSISKRLIENMGGSIHITSKEGQWTTVVIRLPKSVLVSSNKSILVSDGQSDRLEVG
ncbi:MAG: HAMP domain-containing histidine kinase [Henriciella sp.]|nr:HAMP domain-containing histidine kinase [Henriciella sp.]